ncbi:cell division protein FtsZ [Hyphomicrobiales bacterium]|nr:cell division protein FtsZ [Hyphomicrobiales bacterium]
MSTYDEENFVSNSSITLETPEVEKLRPRISLIGVGGGGGNALKTMVEEGLDGVELFAVNTDVQDLENLTGVTSIPIGSHATQGMGAGADPKIGKKAAEESQEEIRRYLEGTHMLFITACLGGGTGTGAAPVIAQLAKDMGILTVGIVTTPWRFEGKKRMLSAKSGVDELCSILDTVIVIPNQNIFRVINEKTPMKECEDLVNKTLHDGVSAISALIMKNGSINIDFADVKTIMQHKGKAVFGVGTASGEDRAILSAEAAISNPMLDDLSLKGTKGLLVSLTAGSDINPFEIDSALSLIQKDVGDDCEVIFGVFPDDEIGDSFRTAVIATGMEQNAEETVVDLNIDNNPSGQNFVDILDENNLSSVINEDNIELEVKKITPDVPHNISSKEDSNFDEGFSQSIESLADENISSLPEAEDWENDDGVPLFNNDRFDPSQEDKEDESQLEIPALQRFFGRIKGN